MAAALTLGTGDPIHYETSSTHLTHDHATAFLHPGLDEHRVIKMLLDPEVSAYQGIADVLKNTAGALQADDDVVDTAVGSSSQAANGIADASRDALADVKAEAHMAFHGQSPEDVQVMTAASHQALDEATADMLAAGIRSPGDVKAAAAALHATLDAAQAEELQADDHAGSGMGSLMATPDSPGEDFPRELAESLKTAIMPLPMLPCVPFRYRHSAARCQKVPLAPPPASREQFI
jgi:hypothetical protein